MVLSGSMVSCSRRRGASAPAGAPRVAEWSSAALAVARARGGGGRSALPALDRLNELALSHPAYSGDAHGLRHPLQFRQQHAGQPTARGTCPVTRRLRRRSGRGSGAGPWLGRIRPVRGIPGQIPGTGEELGGFAHEGSFPELRRRLTRAGRPGVTARRVDRAKLCTKRGLAPSRGAVCPRSPDHVGAPEDESPDRPARHTFLARTSGPVAFLQGHIPRQQWRRGRGGPKIC